MRPNKEVAWVIYWQNRAYDGYERPESKMLGASANMIPHIHVDDFDEFERLLMMGAFRVAIIDYSACYEVPYRSTRTENYKSIKATARAVATRTYPVNLVVVFGPQGKEEPVWFDNVVLVTDHESEFGTSGVWELIKKSAAIPRTQPDSVPPIYSDSEDDTPPTYQETFNLPSELADAATQYLLFFRKFLEDIGIPATTAASNDAGKVLFSVEPKDPNVALKTIHDALRVYLQLPQANYTIVTDDSTEKIKALQLGSEIDMLKSRLQLATALLQTKDTTIAAKNDQLQAKTALIEAKDDKIQRLMQVIVGGEGSTVEAVSQAVIVEGAEEAIWLKNHFAWRYTQLNLAKLFGAGQAWVSEQTLKDLDALGDSSERGEVDEIQ